MAIHGEHAIFDQAVTVSTTVMALPTSFMGQQVVRAILSVETAGIRYRYNGADPDAQTGHLLQAGQGITVEGAYNIGKFRFIRATSTDATVFLTLEAP